jgi:type I restriction enzyme, S subunit
MKHLKSDLGATPKDWKIFRFADVCEVNPSYKLKDSEIYSFIDMASLNEDSPKVKSIQFKPFQGQSSSKFKNGDVLFARITPCTENGKTALVNEITTEYGFGSTEFIVLSPKEEKLDSLYLYYLVKDSRLRNKAIARMVGSTGRQRVPNEFFKEELVLGLPNVNEQRKIAAILSSVDDAIEKTEAIIEQTEKVKKGLMQQLLTKGIGHTKFKKTEIGEIPEEWEVKNIGELAEKILGGGTPSREVQNYYKGNIPWATVKDITYYILNTTEEYISDEAVENSATNVIPAGNVIIATRIGLGKVFMNIVDMAINQDLKGIIPKTELIEAEYLLWCLLSKAEKIESMGTGTTVKGIRLEQLKEILLPIPQKSEQKRIVSILNNLEEKIKNERKKHITLLLLKKGLMQVLLTGEVRVKVEDEVMSK